MSTDFLQRVIIARVGYRVFEPGHSLLVRKALVAQETRGNNASRYQCGCCEVEARI